MNARKPIRAVAPVFAKAVFVAVAVSVLSLAACSGGSKGKTLELWTLFGGEDRITFVQMVDAYNATNPEYRVRHVFLGGDTLYTRMQLAVSSGRGIPDIAINHIELIPLYAEQGRLTDLAPFLSGSPIKKENYIPRAWEMSDISGGHYGIPLDVHSFVLHVNWDLYEKYGLTDLDDGVLTWDELLATAEKVKGDGVIPVALSWLRLMFLASYAQLGGTLSEDGVNPSFDNDIARRVLAHYRNLVAAGVTNQDGEDTGRLFLSGKVLYMPGGAWMINSIREVGLNFRTFDYPVFDPAIKGNWASSHNFVIPARKNLDPERVAASLEFINWIGEHSETWGEAGHVPAHKGGHTSVFAAQPQAFLADENDELKIFGYKYYGHVVDSLDKIYNDVFFGRLDIETGLRQAMQETRDRIAAEG